MRYGADPLLLLRELGRMGRLTVKASTAAIPPLAELEPQRCYVSWEMMLVTTATVDAIRDVFIFVEDSCELAIRARRGRSGAAVPEKTAATVDGEVRSDGRGTAGVRGRPHRARRSRRNAAVRAGARPISPDISRPACASRRRGWISWWIWWASW